MNNTSIGRTSVGDQSHLQEEGGAAAAVLLRRPMTDNGRAVRVEEAKHTFSSFNGVAAQSDT